MPSDVGSGNISGPNAVRANGDQAQSVLRIELVPRDQMGGNDLLIRSPSNPDIGRACPYR